MAKTSRNLFRTPTRALAALALLISTLFLFGCPERDEGPLEKAGRKLDEATESAAAAAEEAGDEIGDASREVRDAVEDAADQVDDD